YTPITATDSRLSVSWPVCTSHIRRVPSWPHETNCFPSGEKSSERIFPSCPLNSPSLLPFVNSQSWIGPSWLAVAIRFLSGDSVAVNAGEAVNEWSCFPLSIDQVRTSPSVQTVTAVFPSLRKP